MHLSTVTHLYVYVTQLSPENHMTHLDIRCRPRLSFCNCVSIPYDTEMANFPYQLLMTVNCHLMFNVFTENLRLHDSYCFTLMFS